MTTLQEPTGEAWVRNVNKRLAILERLPRSGGSASISSSDLTMETSVAFDADVLLSSGTAPDPTLGTDVRDIDVGVSEDGVPVDPYLIEDYDDYPAEDRTPLSASPPTPSDPIIEQRTGGIAVIWDGTGAGGTEIPVSMMLVEVHRSLSQDFDPDEATYCGSFLDAGVIVFADQEYEVQWWYRFVLLTMDGRRSTPSNAVEAMAHKITPFEVGFSATDIDFDGAIASATAAAINAVARTNYSNNPSLLNHTGSVFAEWVGMEWIDLVDGGSASDGLYPVIDGGTASTTTFTDTLDGGQA